MRVEKQITKLCVLIGVLFFFSTHGQDKTLRSLEEKEWSLARKPYKLFYKENKTEEAYKLSHQLLKTLKTDASKSYLTCLISSYFVSNQISDSIIFYAKKTLSYKNFSNDSVRRKRNIMGTVNLGNGYFGKGLYDKAKNVYFEGIDKSKKWGITKEYYNFTSNLANIYYSENKYKKAMFFCEKSLESSDKLIKMSSTLLLGNIYGELKNYEKSNEYYYKVLKISDNSFSKLGVKFNIIFNDEGLGITKGLVSRLKEIIKESNNKGFENIEKEAIKKLAHLYKQRKKYKEAEELQLKLLEEDEKKGNLKEMLSSYGYLKDIAKEENDFKKALTFSEKYLKMKDSIRTLQKAKEINALEVKYETLQKESEIFLLKKEQQIKESKIKQQAYVRNIILIGSGLIICSILLLLLFYYQKLKTQKLLNKTQKEINYQKIKALMKKQELELIKASIEGQDNERKRLAKGLHDSIGSSMAAIKLQLEKVPVISSKLQKIKSNLNDTYEQIRELSHNLLPKKIRENDYAELLKEYLKNINEISDVKIDFVVIQQEKINNIDKFLQNEIFAILQELITNTIKHAEAKEMDITLEVVRNTIYLHFEDDGIGFNTNANNKGIGLENIKNRIEQLSGNYVIDSHPKRGTLFKMEILTNTYLVNEVV